MEISAQNEATRLFLYHLSDAFFHEEKKNFAVTATFSEGTAFVQLERKHTFSRETATIDLSLHREAKRGESAALGLAFAKAAKAFTPYVPPYGTLIGVRPVKVPLFYLKNGLNQNQVISILKEQFLVSDEKARLLTELAEKERLFAQTLDGNDGMLYLSIPFCPSRCSYCSFVSSAAPKSLALIPDYLFYLHEDIKNTAALFREIGKKLRAVYIGGGTPGILSKEQMDALLDTVETNFDLSRAEEFCVEMGRPDTVNREKLKVLHRHGVNRISINPQTTCDKTLERIGRRHSAADFFRAMEEANDFSFHINCDLISSLPGETPDVFLQSVQDVMNTSPDNVTIHALCKKKSADDQEEKTFSSLFADAVREAHKLCINRGYTPYYLYRQKMSQADQENLGFAKDGTVGIYNLAMMEDLCDIFSCGAGGIGKLVPKEKGGRIRRFPAFKYPFEYLDHPEKQTENLALMKSILQTEIL